MLKLPVTHYEIVRSDNTKFKHNLLPITQSYTGDLVTLMSHMTPGRENGYIKTFSLKGVLTFLGPAFRHYWLSVELF